MDENLNTQDVNSDKNNVIKESTSCNEMEELNPQIGQKKIENKENNTTVSDCSVDKFFYTELMVTAGPRKNFTDDANEGDFDLGEDSVGCFVKKDKTCFWLLDGTSDSPRLKDSEKKEFFSSRLLAQELGYHIQRLIWEKTLDTFNSQVVLENAFGCIKESWQKRINELSEADKDTLQKKVEEKTQLLVSTTIILGMLAIDGSLDISQIGDSVIVVNPEFVFPENKGRFFIIIKTDEKGELTITTSSDNSFEDTRCRTERLQDVESIILASDGVSKNTLAWLKIRKPDFRDPVFRKTISAIRQGTCDDKALCAIQILTDD